MTLGAGGVNFQVDGDTALCQFNNVNYPFPISCPINRGWHRHSIGWEGDFQPALTTKKIE